MDGLDLNLRHLRALGEIIRLGSLSAAAELVGMSQPALTQGLAKLESQLGVVLFDRGPTGVAPTDQGRMIALRADAAIEHLHVAVRDGMRSGRAGFSRPERLITGTQLRAFLAVADHGGFAAAAAATGMAAPSLHRAVRDLETIGRNALLESRGRGIQLSPAGRKVARGARLASTELNAAMADVGGAVPQEIVVGAMPLARARVLPRAIAAFLNRGERTSVRVVEGSWRDLVDPVRDGAIDFMIGALRSEAPPDLEQHALFEDELVVVGRAGHPLAGREPPRDELARYAWIVAARGTPLRAQWHTLFDGIETPQIPVECGSVVVIRGILAGTDLLTLLSPAQVSVEIASGLLATIGRPIAHGLRTIGVTSRRGWRPTAAQRLLLDELTSATTNTIPEFE